MVDKNSFYTIVFQNEHFVIVDKAPLVLSVPSRMGEDETRPVLGLILEKDLGRTVYPVHRLDFEVQGLIMYALTPAAHKAGNAWFEQKIVFKKYSAILSPTMPILPPKFSEIEKLTPLQNYMMDILTVGPNLAGMPHISVPFGKDKGLPIGMMITTDHFKESTMIQIASHLEMK